MVIKLLQNYEDVLCSDWSSWTWWFNFINPKSFKYEAKDLVLFRADKVKEYNIKEGSINGCDEKETAVNGKRCYFIILRSTVVGKIRLLKNDINQDWNLADSIKEGIIICWKWIKY